MQETYPYLIGGAKHSSENILEVRNPYSGEIFQRVSIATKSDIQKAIRQAVDSRHLMKVMPSYERADILDKISSLITKRKEELATTITNENGKTIRDSRMEVDRAATTFRIASEEAKRIAGEEIPMDLRKDGINRIGILRRFPLGCILGMTPFNFPLNLSCHKIAPALACGNTFIHRPSSITPVTGLLLGEIIASSGFPQQCISTFPTTHEDADLLIKDDRIQMISFTGSPNIGWAIKERCGKKKTTLELGGNGCVILHEDADIAHACERCLRGAFAYAGQVCISVQRIYIHENIYQKFLDIFLKKVATLKTGDPFAEDTDISPLISETEAKRAEKWIVEAVKAGSELLCGGKRNGSFIEPTILAKAPIGTNVCDKEAFAPLVIVYPYQNFQSVLKNINAIPYGLQAGIFTQDIRRIMEAYTEIEVGALMVNEVPTFRLEHMPYGGIKLSGMGREGLKYAIQEMTEPRLLIIKS